MAGKNSSMATHDNEVRYLDGGWGWVVMAASFLSQTVIGSVYFGYGVLLPEWINEFHSSGAVTSFVGSTVGGVISISGPFASWMILKTSCRTTHVLGGLFLAASAIACSLATNIVQIFVFYSVLAGIGGSLCYISSVITLSEYFKYKRSVAVGIASSGIGFGSFVFPVLYEYLIDLYGWRGVMLISGAIYGNMIPFGMVMYPIAKAPKSGIALTRSNKPSEVPMLDINHNEILKETQTQPSVGIERKSSLQLMRAWLRNPLARRKSSLAFNENAKVVSRLSQPFAGFDGTIMEEDESMTESGYLESAYSIIHAPATVSYREQFLELLKKPLFYVLIFHNITMFFGLMIAFGLTTLRAVTDFSMTTQQGALLVSIIGLANLVGRLLWGIIASSQRINTTALFIGLRISAGVLTLLSTLFKSFMLNAINCAMMGLALGNWSIYPVMLGDLFGDRLLAISFGYLETANGVGGILGPLFGGYLYDLSGTYQSSFIASGISIIVGVFPFLFIVLCKRFSTCRPTPQSDYA